MRNLIKFKPGAGAIYAFLILAVVFGSIIGVVFILLNNSPLKSSAASFNVCDFNRDGFVNQGDVDLLGANIPINIQTLTDEQKKFDVNGDGELNTGDVLIVKTNNPNYCVAKEAIATKAPDAPANATCSGTWRTFKELGKSTPEAVVAVGNRIIMVDASPQYPAPGPQHLVAREITINDSTGAVAADTDWYDVKFDDTQSSMVLVPTPGAVSPADIYLYGEVSGQRKVYQGTWSGEKNWTGFKVVSNTADIGGSLGKTGPDAVLVGNRPFRFLSAYEGYDAASFSASSYLQNCSATVSRSACWFYAKNAIAGKTVSMFGEYTGSRQVYLVSVNGNGGGGINIGSINSADPNRDTYALTIPATVANGSYTVQLGATNTVNPTVCTHPSGDRELKISSTAVANRCDFNVDGKVDRVDQELLGSNFFTKDQSIVKKYDLNGDTRLNSGDQVILAQAVRLFPTTTKYCY